MGVVYAVALWCTFIVVVKVFFTVCSCGSPWKCTIKKVSLIANRVHKLRLCPAKKALIEFRRSTYTETAPTTKEGTDISTRLCTCLLQYSIRRETGYSEVRARSKLSERWSIWIGSNPRCELICQGSINYKQIQRKQKGIRRRNRH